MCQLNLYENIKRSKTIRVVNKLLFQWYIYIYISSTLDAINVYCIDTEW